MKTFARSCLAAVTQRVPWVKGVGRLTLALDRCVTDYRSADSVRVTSRINGKCRLNLDMRNMEQRFAFYQGKLEPEQILAARNLYRKGCFYDVGASIGLYSCTLGVYAKAFGGYVRAIEPMSANISILRSQLALNDLTDSDVRIHHLALSDQAGTLEIAFTGDTPGNARVNETHGEKETVRCLTLDELWTQNDRESVGFIKVDCEGWDGRIIAGGRELVRECKPILLVECQRVGMERAGFEMSDLWGLLVGEFNYRCFRVGKRGELISVPEPGTLENLVFVPGESTSVTSIEAPGHV